MFPFVSSFFRSPSSTPLQLQPQVEGSTPISDSATAQRVEIGVVQHSDIADLDLPPSYTFSSKAGEPTIVTIRRSTDPSKEIALDIDFYAIQNVEGARHTFELHFVQFEAGHTSLRGEVRELGQNRLVSGPHNAEPYPILLSFLIHISEADTGEKHSLQQMAQTFVELFAEEGVLGVFDGLNRTRREHNSASQWIQTGPRFERELLSLGRASPEHSEQSIESLTSEEEKEHSHFSRWERSLLERLDESLLLIRNICDDELQRKEHDCHPHNESGWRDDESEPNTVADDSRFFSVSLKFIIGKLRANFFSSREKRSEQIIVSLKLPIGLRPKVCDLSYLTIEVSGPQKLLWLRETYSVKDTDNLLAISPFGNNDEFFRNLFRTLHGANLSALPGQQKLESVVGLLEAYDLKMSPKNLPALIATLWRRHLLPIVRTHLHDPRSDSVNS